MREICQSGSEGGGAAYKIGSPYPYHLRFDRVRKALQQPTNP